MIGRALGPDNMKILVPLDGAAPSESILPWVRALLGMPDARALLLHVSLVPDLDAEAAEGQPRPAPVRCQTYLAEAAQRLGLPPDCVETHVLVGPIAPTIERFAGEQGVGLVALRTSAREGLAYLLFGSTASEILAGTRMPLLALGPSVAPRTEAPAIRRILVPLDGSEIAAAVLPIVIALAKGLGAAVTLFHVYSPDGPVASLQAHAEQLRTAGVPCELASEQGDPAERILDRLRTGGYDLAALATHGISGLRRLLLGSVAEAVLHASPCPVILARPVTETE